MENAMLDRFVQARKNYILSQFQNLNAVQREAVSATEGPLLLLAGAGSGKTTVLINRIANIIRYGRASDSNEVPDYITDDDVLLNAVDVPSPQSTANPPFTPFPNINPAVPSLNGFTVIVNAVSA